LILGDSGLVNHLLQFLTNSVEDWSLFKHIPLDDDVEVNAVEKSLDVNIDFLVG
jgi:hypothetical protein